MAAVFIRAERPELPHQLLLPNETSSSGTALEEVRHGLDSQPPLGGPVVLHCGKWRLSLPELRALQQQLAERSLVLIQVESRIATSLVAAAALGLSTRSSPEPPGHPAEAAVEGAPENDGLTLHHGTLRSGDHLKVGGSVLVLGDVNPGARVSAAGHVMIWGRLRGIAHAGCLGDGRARIVALELRPLQLRIGTAVARGPTEPPPAGFTEEARLEEGGRIVIDPARPQWPLVRGTSLSG
ncbi:septum site-determining protein MinC [Synechococcus sp. Tobar12-5m-g]|jgi:septum site-determining protein MinC|uniref:septum site-determining protein MinC n=1 Tax=unclassified Synechococcus TaxID=2626047 RepID=UPI0020CF904D|nr:MULTISPECIES: septum site-determining protein MinC [unclassified Synechococcus]MCP9773661.1 septum site-determining protein MinC [Synechococcus sp. Tobar12-5m-g]MCP9874634.1 septum site-determining protein MinC [Synechococcus sp. Cruz CV-v-12]